MTEEKKEPLPPGEYVCKILDFQIEPGQKPGDLKAMLTVDVPGLGSKLKVEAASVKGAPPAITAEVAKKLVQFIAQHMERESALLYPFPSIVMHDPYGLLKLIQEGASVSSEAMDFWMVEAQKGRRGGPSA